MVGVRYIIAYIAVLFVLVCYVGGYNISSSGSEPDFMEDGKSRATVKRQTENGQLDKFVTDLRQSQVDLVILMERSKSVGHSNFYNKSRNLVNHVLRKYTRVDPDYVRVSLTSFARDFKIHFDGITKNVSKCDIWETYWNGVVLNDTIESWEGTNVTLAMQQTGAIFQRTSSRHRTRYLWVICKKDIAVDISLLFSEGQNNTITVLLTSVGEGRKDIEFIQNQFVYYTGDVPDTEAAIWRYPRLTQMTNFGQEMGNILTPINATHYCDSYGYTVGFCTVCSSAPVCSPYRCVCTTGNVTHECDSDRSTIPRGQRVGYSFTAIISSIGVVGVICVISILIWRRTTHRHTIGPNGPEPPAATHTIKYVKGPFTFGQAKRYQKAEELRGHLKQWLTRSDYASGIDVDDQKMTIFCPKAKKDQVLTSIQTELELSLGSASKDFINSYKVKPYKIFSISRQQAKIGSSSQIYHLDQRGHPKFVTFGALFVNILDGGIYCLTTSHLEDATGKTFYYSSEGMHVILGKCVAYVQQSNPLLEACLIRIDEPSSCSPGLLPHLMDPQVVFSGPYMGSISKLLEQPKEVIICGGHTSLTRGRMKYFAFEFKDPDTQDRVYGGIVTLPSHPGDFALPGDSGATICRANSQSFLVRDWCLVSHNTTSGVNLTRHAFPSNVEDDEGRTSSDTHPMNHTDEQQAGNLQHYQMRSLVVGSCSIDEDHSSPGPVCLIQSSDIPSRTNNPTPDLTHLEVPVQQFQNTLNAGMTDGCETTPKEIFLMHSLNNTGPTETVPKAVDDAQDFMMAQEPEETVPKTTGEDQIPASRMFSADAWNKHASQNCQYLLESETGDEVDNSSYQEQTLVKSSNSSASPTNTLQEVAICNMPGSQQQTPLESGQQSKAVLNLLREVMAHEAITSHCFGGRISFNHEAPVNASISFRIDLAVEKLQEQIGGDLRLVPILRDASYM